ncbi:MAG: flagellar export chaperone FliS [Eubacteriales bacterium]|jgi:flagellar protein FliS
MNPYKKYKDKSIESMSQGELLVTLYDESIKDLKRAQIALDDKNYDQFDYQLDYFIKIIRYLNNTLDLSQPIAWDLKKLYTYINYDIGRVRAARERRADEIPKLISIMKDLRDGFDGASRKVASSDQRIPEDNSVVV